MSALMQFLETTFFPLLLIFTISNLAAIGARIFARRAESTAAAGTA